MGTSNPFKGGRNGDPLMPSWLDGAGDGKPVDPDAPASEPAQGEPSEPDGPPAGTVLKPGRTLLNKHVRSGGGNDGRERVRRAIGSWVRKGTGGAASGSRRMKAGSAGSVARLGQLLFDASREGIRETLRRLDLGALADRSLREIYASLVDVVCGDGGDLEDSMNRDAYANAVEELMAVEGIDLEKPTPDTINLLVELFIAGTIENRIVNAIFNKLVLLPANAAEALALQKEVGAFVLGAVRSAVAAAGRLLDRAGVRAAVDRIYDSAMAILDAGADKEGGAA